MATKDSRLAQIFREELKKDKSLLGAFLSARSESSRERKDIRNVLPTSGIAGAISQRMFGKPYRYGSGGVRNVGGGNVSDRVSTERLTRIDINGRITAKNTMVLPAMARDMNLMRQNMQKMVTLSGGKAIRKSDMFFKHAGERESLYESKVKKEGSILGTAGDTVGGAASAVGGILGGIGKALGGIVSVGSSVVSGLVGILGSAGGAIFRVIGGALSMLGPFGMVFSGLAAFLIYQIASSINFEKLGKDFDNLYKDIVKGIKDFFGIKDDENAPSIVEQFGRKLDNFFGTTKFTDTLDFIEDTYEDIKISLISHSTSAWESIKDIFKAIGHDIVALVNHHYAEYRTFLGMAGGAYAGGLFFGPKGAIVGAAVGGIGAAVTKTIPKATTEELQKELASQRAKLTMEGPGGDGYRKNPNKPSPAMVIADRARPISQWITDIEAELRKRPGSSTRTGDTISNLRTDYGQRVDRELERMQDDAIERRNLRRERRAAETRNTSPNTPSAVDQGREGRDRGTSPSRVTGISDSGIKFIADREGFREKAYFDNGQYSIGYGTRTDDPEEISGRKTVTREEGMRRLKEYVEKKIRPVLDPLAEKYGWNQSQYDAMASFAYNLGEGALRQVTANGTRTNEQISAAMMEYNKEKVEGKGPLVPNAGLTTRRELEQSLFTSGAPPSPVLGAPRTTPPETQRETSIFADLEKMLGAVFAAIGDTNNAVQAAVAAAARPAQQTANGPIPSPYDSQLFETLLRHHTELGSSISGS